jgi:hypothetical protein
MKYVQLYSTVIAINFYNIISETKGCNFYIAAIEKGKCYL